MTDDPRMRLEVLAPDPEALGDWVRELLERGDPRLPEVARWAAERGDATLLIDLMDDFVVHGDLRTVEAIRASLEARPEVRDALAARIEAMLSHHAPEQRRAGALFAGLLELRSLAPRLIVALDDPYFLTRTEAATALGRLKHRPAVERLRVALGDVDLLTRNAAIEALTAIPDPDLLTAYTGRFTDDPPEYHRGALDDALPRARAHAIRVLRDARPPCAREVLSHYIEGFELWEAEGDEVTDEDRGVVELARSVLAGLDD